MHPIEACFHPLQSGSMRRVRTLAALLAVLALLVAGCGGGGSSENSDGETTATTATTASGGGSGAGQGDATAGEIIWVQEGCNNCHAIDGMPATSLDGPNFDKTKPSHEEIIDVVTKFPSFDTPMISGVNAGMRIGACGFRL